MSNKAARIGLSGVVLATAFGVLLYSSLGESLQYYKYVDEVMAEPAVWHGKNLQVHGVVVPDTFKADSEVVLTGTMDAKGFHATEMTAKCPSKYDAAPAANPAAGSSTPTPSGGA